MLESVLNEPYPAKYPVTHANVYTGAQAVKDALTQGAILILAGRVADTVSGTWYSGTNMAGKLTMLPRRKTGTDWHSVLPSDIFWSAADKRVAVTLTLNGL